MIKIRLCCILLIVFSKFIYASSETILGAVTTEVSITVSDDVGFKLKMQKDHNSVYVLSDLVIRWNGNNTVIKKVNFPEIQSPELTDVQVRGDFGDRKILHLIIPYNYTDESESDINVKKYCDAIRLTFNDGMLIKCYICEASDKARTRWIESVYDEKQKIIFESNRFNGIDVNPYLKGEL